MGLCINLPFFKVGDDKCVKQWEQGRADRAESSADKVEARNQPGASGSFTDDVFGFLGGAMESGNQTAASIFGPGGAGGEVAAAYMTGGTSLLGGLFGGVDPATGLPVPVSPLVPLGIGLGAIGLVILATRK